MQEDFKTNHIYHADVLAYLAMVPDAILNCIVTSVPYYGLRSYNIPDTKWPEVKYRLFGFEIVIPAMECCLGLEKTPEAFIGHLVYIFRLARVKMKDDGVLWCNIGDSYWGGKGKSGQSYSAEAQGELYSAGDSMNKSYHQIGGKNKTRPLDGKHHEIKGKDMAGMPWMLAFALRADGYWLRQDIIWSKKNCMPESVSDRCTKSHEYIFMLTKSPKYYFDAYSIATPYADKTLTTFGAERKNIPYDDGTGLVASSNWGRDVPERKPKDWNKGTSWSNSAYAKNDDPLLPTRHKKDKKPGNWATADNYHDTNPGYQKRNPREGVDNKGGNQGSGQGIPVLKKDCAGTPMEPEGSRSLMGKDGTGFKGHSGNFDKEGNLIGTGLANKRSVWSVAPKGIKGAHFAVYPEELIVDCIKAGCPVDGLVCDLFMGSGTTAVVARKLNRNFTGCDLNKDYIEEIANPRLISELGLFI